MSFYFSGKLVIHLGIQFKIPVGFQIDYLSATTTNKMIVWGGRCIKMLYPVTTVQSQNLTTVC